MSKNLIVIPVHNEEKTIYEVVIRSLQYADVSVTDDGSRDHTSAILQSILLECEQGNHPHQLNIITHPVATHIPRAIQDGLIFAMTINYDFVVTMDAGLSHDPDALPDFLKYDKNVDVVIGHRVNTQNIPLYRQAVSAMAGIVVNYSLTNSYFNLRGPCIRDCTSGYRRYSKRAYELIAKTTLKSKAFDFHMEALSLCFRAGMNVEEIPVNYNFTNSSFNKKALSQAIKFGMYLIATKKNNISDKT
jgi:dolichol-phosphate mannosyltransferase